MKKILILTVLLSNIFAFDVVFTKIFTKYVVPEKEAILIKTKADNLTFPFKYIKTENGYILLGDIRQINMWLDNEFYAPKNTEFKNIKIAYINTDKLQYMIVNKIKNTYKKCKIKELIFLSPDENKIITKPETVKLKYKVILDCK
jgi:hypothetical protein